jgi:hypothetical protein
MSATRVEFPADPSCIPEMRALAGAMSARFNLTVDAIEDAKHALDEALTIVVGVAQPESTITCTLHASAETFQARVSVPHDADDETDVTSGLAWKVLCGMTHETRIHRDEGQTTVHFAVNVDASAG